MKEKPLVFTKETFRDFMMKQLKESFPSFDFAHEEVFSLSMKEGEELRGILHLHNAWAAYETSGDLNEVMHYLEAMVSAQQHVNTKGPHFRFPQDQELVYPALRSVNYAQDDSNAGLLTAPIATDIMWLYIADYPQFVMALTENMLIKNLKHEKNEALTPEELKETDGYRYLRELIIEQAWKNQKKRGWVNHVFKKKTTAGMFYHYYHPEYDYQAQFFIQEWTKRELGPLFYVTFLTKNSTLVVVPNGTTPSKFY